MGWMRPGDVRVRRVLGKHRLVIEAARKTAAEILPVNSTIQKLAALHHHGMTENSSGCALHMETHLASD
jgi:hypothetical protein